MRISIISLGVYPIMIGGAEVHTYYHARELARRGHDVLVLLEARRGMPKRGRIDGFTTLGLGSSLRVVDSVLVVIEGLVRLLVKRKEVDIIHVHFCIYFSVIAYLMNILNSKPYVVTCHGADVIEIQKGSRWSHVHMKVQKKVLSRATVVTAVSEQVKDILEQEYGLPNGKVKVVHNGVDEEEMQDALSSVPRTDPNLVLYLANLLPAKGPLTAVMAIQQALSAVPRLKMAMIGEGSEREAVERYIRENRLGDAISLVGRMNHKEALTSLARASYFLMTSVSEGGNPIALMEAMALGKPVVAPAVGGISDILIDGYNGLLVPSRSPQKLAEALARLASDDTLAMRLGNEARKTSLSFGWSQVVDRYLAIYSEIRQGKTTGNP